MVPHLLHCLFVLFYIHVCFCVCVCVGSPDGGTILRPLTRIELEANVQASPIEISEALRGLGAVEKDGRCTAFVMLRV